MKRSFSLRERLVIATGTALIAVCYGAVRLAYGLFLPDVRGDLHLGAAAVGWVSSAASGAYCVGAAVAFVLARGHARACVVAAATTASLGALGMAASTTPGWFAASAVVGSASAGIASPALVRLVGERVREPTRDRAQAIVNSGTGPGLVAAGVLALALLPDWRAAWAWTGVVAALVGVAVLLAAGRSGTSPERGRQSPAALTVPDRDWFRAHTVPLAVALAFGAGTASVWTFGRSVLVEAGAGAAVSVALWVAVGLGGTSVVVTSRWTDGLRPRALWRLTVGVTAVAVLVLGLLPEWTGVALAAGVLFGWGYTAGTGALIAWTTTVDAARAPAGTAVLFVVLVLGQALGAAGLGALVAGVGASVTFTVAAAVTFGAAVVRTRPRRSAGGPRSEERAQLDLPAARP